MTLEERKEMLKTMQLLKEKKASWQVIGESTLTSKITSKALKILTENPQITIEDYKKKMNIKE